MFQMQIRDYCRFNLDKCTGLIEERGRCYKVLFTGELFFFKIISSIYSNIRVEFLKNLPGFHSRTTTTKVSKHFFCSTGPFVSHQLCKKAPGESVGNLERNERTNARTNFANVFRVTVHLVIHR